MISKLSEEQIGCAIEIYEDGASFRTIADSFGVSDGCVRNAFKNYGIRSVNHNALRAKLLPVQVEEAYQRYQDGAFYKEIAQAYGVSASTVFKAFRDAGLPSLGRRPRKRT